LRKRWVLPAAVPVAVQDALVGYTDLQQRILYARGIHDRKSAERYLLGRDVQEHDPFLMQGMKRAVNRIREAERRGEHVVVYGDYDADGITATTLLLEAFKAFGLDASHYIPSRFDEGYGLNTDALDEIAARGASLVVTVDCGVRAHPEAEHAARIGLDLIVTDHHHPGTELPPALAVINPRQAGDAYPFKQLAGVGLAYKLAQALSEDGSNFDPTSSLDLVAIGTVADLAPLVGENRTLVQKGLVQLNVTERIGLRSLVLKTGYSFGGLDTISIGFGIGPRLNAAGRLTTAEKALQLLQAQDSSLAEQAADELDRINVKRRRITADVLEKARDLVIEHVEQPGVLFAVDESFEEGVVGLAASRLTDEFYRPAVVAHRGDAETRASARSIPEFHITEALEACSDLLIRYGGHRSAAGFSVRNQDITLLKDRLNRLAMKRLSSLDLRPELNVDACVKLTEMDWELLDFIHQLEPCGQKNPRPIFAAEHVRILEKRCVGSEGKHLKLLLSDGGKAFDAIAFRLGHLEPGLPDEVDVAFRLERNDYMGVSNLQLNIEDVRPAGSFEDAQLTLMDYSGH
jgi:single-stranded-DNA-specific exonuclease